MFNNNIRCIETTSFETMTGSAEKFNNNIRCIETGYQY